MPRKQRVISYTGIYHVVIRGADRQLLFEEDRDYRKYLELLEYYKEECSFDLYAYCLMSNHVHLLIHINDTSLSSVFRKINTSYAMWFNMKYQRTGFVQQGRFYSEPVNDFSYLKNVLCYIHHNPLLAGLEKECGTTYGWSSFFAYKYNDSSLVDINYLLDLLHDFNAFFTLHEAYTKKASENNDPCNILDVNTTRKRLPDDVVRNIIYEISGCRTTAEFQKLTLLQRNSFIIRIREKGVSVRQINRLTGTPKGVIERIIAKCKTPF